MKILKEDKLDDIIEALDFKDAEADNFEDPALRMSLKYIHVLDQLEAEALKSSDTVGVDDLFYSRYYWFIQFKERYFTLYGHDEGLEQQGFKMIGDYNERFPERIDWNIIEHIESNSL